MGVGNSPIESKAFGCSLSFFVSTIYKIDYFALQLSFSNTAAKYVHLSEDETDNSGLNDVLEHLIPISYPARHPILATEINKTTE